MTRVALASLLALAACSSPHEGPLMLPGEDCMNCHGGAAAKAVDAPVWTIAGTVYAAPDADPSDGVDDALVHVSDAAGVTFTLKTNRAGNFYSAESVVFPLEACVEREGVTRCMQNVVQGGCNGCHTIPSQNHAPGRISAP
jgi:hypothetical protein